MALAGVIFSSPLAAQPLDLTGKRSPALVITNDPLPQHLRKSVYSKPRKMSPIRPHDITGSAYFVPTETSVGRKVNELQNDLLSLQHTVTSFSSELEALQRAGESRAADYYATVATISTQLQAGTTPGNPRLEARIMDSRIYLEDLEKNLALVNQLAVRAANAASGASFLQEAVRSAYSLPGGIEEDHVHLAQLEDYIYNTIVIIERVLNNANDDITRISAYLATERNNLRTLAVAVSNGDLYNKSLSSRPFSHAAPFQGAVGAAPVTPVSVSSDTSLPQVPAAPAATDPRLLVKIKFDRTDVDYEQPLYVAASEALQRYPGARFDLVAVYPSEGNAAKVAIESTRARRNAERVLRSLTQMGLPMDSVDLSYAKNEGIRVNEVHLYLK